MCRRPETDYRLPIVHAARGATTTDVHTPPKDVNVELTSNDKCPAEHESQKQHKMMDVNTTDHDEMTMVSSLQQEETPGKVVTSLLSVT